VLSRGLNSMAVESMGLQVLPKSARSSMMRRTFAYLLLTLVVILTLTANLVQAKSTSAMMSPHHLSQLWADLLGGEPTSTRAVLKLSKYPDSATDFFASKLSIIATENHKTGASWRYHGAR